MNLTYNIKKSPEVIFDYLTDMQKFESIHPVIYKIDDLGGNQYLIHEKLKFGFIPYTFTYIVTVEGDFNAKIVSMKTTVMKMVKIDIYITISENKNDSIVKEVITFKSWMPVKPVMNMIFKKQHKQLFANMEQ